MNKLLRDPLSHFLAIGMVLFALSFWLAEPASYTERVIHISAGDVEGIKTIWAKTPDWAKVSREVVTIGGHTFYVPPKRQT